MKQQIFSLLAISLLFFACSGGDHQNATNELKDSIASMEKNLFSSPELSVTADKANQMVLLYSRFVNENPKDSMAPLFLFKAAEMFRAVNNGTMANTYYERVIKEYPESEKASVALFLQGFVYENILQDFTLAGKCYQEYLDKFPDGEFAKDAAVLIQNLGKSPEEMIREFEAKNDTIKQPA